MPSISGRITETGLGGITLGTRSWGVFSFGRGGDARRYREIYLAAAWMNYFRHAVCKHTLNNLKHFVSGSNPLPLPGRDPRPWATANRA